MDMRKSAKSSQKPAGSESNWIMAEYMIFDFWREI